MKVKLGELTKIRTGKLDANASSEDGQYPFFTCSREPLRIATYSYDCECVLVAGNGDLNVKYYNGKFDAYQRTYIIEDNGSGKLYMPYLYFFMDGYVEELRKQAIGGVIKYIKLGNLTDALIELPDIKIQKMIVDILAKAKEITSDRMVELQRLDELIKARFVEMFGDPVFNPRKWDTYRLEECLERIDNGKSFVCSEKPREGRFPAVLKLSAATYGDYRPAENKALLDESQFVESAEVHTGDLLFTRKNTPELVGMAAYVQETPEKLMMPDLIFRLVTNERMNPIFLWQLINCKEFRPVIQGISGGSAKSMSNISKERLGKISVICPPRQIQDQLVPFVAQVDKSKAAVQKSLDETQLLFNSLMQKYFG
jgi:type I restriction enzyme S subunit